MYCKKEHGRRNTTIFQTFNILCIAKIQTDFHKLQCSALFALQKITTLYKCLFIFVKILDNCVCIVNVIKLPVSNCTICAKHHIHSFIHFVSFHVNFFIAWSNMAKKYSETCNEHRLAIQYVFLKWQMAFSKTIELMAQ